MNSINGSCLFVSVSLRFTDSLKPVDHVVLEINGTTNYSISCRTDDPNASITLLFAKVSTNVPVPVGGRISLDNQVYTIHGLKESDSGVYTCKARSSQGDEVTRQLPLFISKGTCTLYSTIIPVLNIDQSRPWQPEIFPVVPTL